MKNSKIEKIFILFLVSSFLIPMYVSRAVDWTPFEQIPGLPSGVPITLNQYLVGLYNFLLSIVGIIAVGMMILGGVRYITAAGSESAIGDAKATINGALYGLVFALLAWVFVYTINPDVLYIKQPGLTKQTYLSCAKLFTPSTCTCNNGNNIGVFPNPDLCNEACKSADLCKYNTNVCIRDGVNDPASPRFNSVPNNGRCLCIDKKDILPIAGSTCQKSCEQSDCISADPRLEITNIEANFGVIMPGFASEEFIDYYPNAKEFFFLVHDAYRSFTLNPPYTCSWDLFSGETDGIKNSFHNMTQCFNVVSFKLETFPEVIGTHIATLTITDAKGLTSKDKARWDIKRP